VSNRRPEKCGFEAIKRENPWPWIHPLILGYKTDITKIFRLDIYRFVGGICISEVNKKDRATMEPCL
jgi:hypothetical protein